MLAPLLGEAAWHCADDAVIESAPSVLAACDREPG